MHRWIAAAAASGMLLVGCGSDDDAAKPAATKPAPVAATAAS